MFTDLTKSSSALFTDLSKRSNALLKRTVVEPWSRMRARKRKLRTLRKSLRRNLNDPQAAFTVKHLRDLIFFHPHEKTKGGKAIGFAGPQGREGTTSLSLLLGLSLGEFRRNRVIFIDGRLERKSFDMYTDMFGLSRNSLDYNIACGYLQCYSTRNQNLCFLMPAADIESLEFFSNDELVPLFAELREAFDYIIFDMPPVLNSSETRLLIPHLDLFFLVCAARQTVFTDVEKCKAMIAGVGGSIKGVVLNKQRLPLWMSSFGRDTFF